jgi:integrase
MKNGDSQTVPLTPTAIEILERRYADRDQDQWVFPSDRKGRKTGVVGHLASPKNAWKKLLERAKIEDLRIHDLRRTLGSYMAIQGVSTAIIGKGLGHRSPQATAIYARLTNDPVRLAMENAQLVFRKPESLAPVKDNVIKLEKI